MPWLRIDDGFDENEKIVGLSDGAFRMYVELLCYAARNLTDGHISDASFRRRFGARTSTKRARELGSAGLLNRTETGWLVHDFLDYNPSREQVLARREADAKRQASRRDRVRASRRDSMRPGPAPLIKGKPEPIQNAAAYVCCGRRFTAADYFTHLDAAHEGREPDSPQPANPGEKASEA